jgi:hypothetical protein
MLDDIFRLIFVCTTVEPLPDARSRIMAGSPTGAASSSYP